MPLMPKRVKYRKMHRGNRSGFAYRGSTVAFGQYGSQALERCEARSEPALYRGAAKLWPALKRWPGAAG